jgi:hypothetical protein
MAGPLCAGENMKSKFPGYFRLTEEDYKKLWADGIFAFDASALLNLYRFSTEARKDFLRVLEALKDRIWVPYQRPLSFSITVSK